MKSIIAAFAVLTVACASATSFYWCGAGEPNANGSRNWEDPANWLVNGTTVTTTSYPGVSDIEKGTLSTGDQVWFTNKTEDEAVVKLSRALTVGYLYLHQATTPVTLVGGTTTNDVLVVNNDFNADTASYSVTLDHIAIRRTGNVTLGPQRALTLKNGANFYVNNFKFSSGASVTMSEGAWLRSNSFAPTGDDIGNMVTLSGGSTWLCASALSFPKKFSLSLSEGSQFLVQNDAGTSFYNLNAYGGVNAISLVGGSLLRCNELYIGYPGQVITLDESTIDARGACLIGNTLPGGGEINFKGAAPKFTVKGVACRVQNNNAGMNVPFVFRYFVPEGGYAEPPFQYLYNTTTECFGSWVNPTKLTQFVVDPNSPAAIAGTLTDTALAYSFSGFYRSSAKPNYTDITDTTGGTLRFTDDAGVTDTTASDGKKSKYIKASIGSGAPAPAPTVAKSSVGSAVAVAVNRKTFTATAVVLAKSTVAAKTVAVLYASGEGVANEAVAQMEIPCSGAYDLVWTAPTGMFERNYQHWIVLVDYDAGGNELSSSTSAPTTVMSKDTTTYTWTGKGETGVWSDPANWNGNQGEDCLHFPGTSGATATFPANTKVTFVQDGPMTVGWVNANSTDVELTFVRAEGLATNEVKWTFNSFNPNAARVKVILDGGCIYTGGFNLGDHGVLELKNGANLYASGDFNCSTWGDVTLADDSWMSCNQYYFGGGTTVIRDSTLWSRSHDLIGNNKTGGHIRFEGTHPLWWHNNNDGHFKSNLDNANVQIDFLVPEGGYAAAPIRAIGTQKHIMGWNGASTQSAEKRTMTFNVLDESPANRTDATITTPLVSWPKGIDKTLCLAGKLPDDGTGTDDAFVWSEEANPLTLGVTIKGTTHANELQVSGMPEFLAADELSPSYGFTVVDGSADCSAPADYVHVSEKKRAIVTGWKLYAVDAATRVRTLVDHGLGSSYTYRNTDGLWHELEWQWKVEYAISVTSAGNGTAQAEAVWVETGKKARLSVVPADGYAFFKWTGDVDLQRDKTENLFFTVRNRPYTLTANFLEVADSYVGGELADYVAQNAGKVILLPEGLYDVKKQIVVPNGTIVRGRDAGAVAVVKAIDRISDQSDARGSIFKLTGADAAIENITVTTAYPTMTSINNRNNYDYGRGVWIEGNGLVDNCVITNCRSLYRNDGGGGVYLNGGGVVRNTKLIANTSYASGGNDASGAGVYMKGSSSLVENCEIRLSNTVKPSQNPSASSAVCIEGGTLRNCLIADNTHTHTTLGSSKGIGIKIQNAGTKVIENCTIAGNYQLASSIAGGLFINNQPTTVRNCIIWDNVNGTGVLNWVTGNDSYLKNSSYNCTTPALGANGITSDPSFTDAEHGDYTIGLSGAVDSALYLEWMDDVTDLAGNERIAGDGPDMGCYEFKMTGLAVGFDVETVGKLGTDSLTLNARVVGPNLEGLVYTWTLTDQNGVNTVRSGDDLATLVIEMPVGRYDVALTVKNVAGDSASAVKPTAVEVFPSDVYVSKNGRNEYPYNSFTTGAKTLEAALAAAADGTVIHVESGLYVMSDTLVVNKGVTLVSEDGLGSVILYAAAKTTSSPILMLAHAKAVISGIVIDGTDPATGKQTNQWGGLQIAQAGGTVTNCIVRNNTTVSISVPGAGCRMEGGTLVDCIFSNNWTQCSGGGAQNGGALAITGAGALVQRCRIVGNKIASGSPSKGGGIYLNAGAVLNTFVANNLVYGNGGGIAVEGSGVVRNCTVVCNEATTANGGIWQNGGTVKDCLVWNNIANGQAQDVDDPGFVDANGGDFHLTGASPAVDAVADAADLGEFDLDLLPRISGEKADAGCYEYDQSKFSVGIKYEKLSAFAPGKVRFVVVLTPETAQLDEEKIWWTFDGTEPSADNYAAKGAVVEREFGPGVVTARFKTVYEGETYVIDKVEWFTFFGEHVYVNLASANAVYPFASRETAASNYEEAVLCVQADATLHLGPGTYPVNRTQYLSVPMTVVSDEGPARTILDLSSSGSWATPQAFVISDSGVTIDGIGFKTARSWNHGGAISMSAGTVTNCVFTDCLGYTANRGGAVYATGGHVVDCLFEGCGSTPYNTSGTGNGTVLYLFGPSTVAERCLILNSHTVPKAGYYVHANAPVAVEDRATLRNTVIANSTLEGCGGIVAWSGTRVENCTVYMNASTNQPGCAAGIAISNATAKVVNTIVYGNTTKGAAATEIGGVAGFADCFENCLIGIDPQLRGKGSKAYRPATGSPCIDAGKKLDWMTGAIDLYGQPRVQGQGADKKPDIGAGEYHPSGFRLLVK